MYAFMYVDIKKVPVEDYFPTTKTFVKKYKKMSTTGLVPRKWLGFSTISSEGY